MSIAFNGTTQYGTILNTSVCPVQGDAFSGSVWVKRNGAPAAECGIVCWTEDGVADSSFGVRMNTAGGLGICVKQNSSGTIQKSFTAINCADNNWHCITFYYDPAAQAIKAVVDQQATPLSVALTTGNTVLLNRLTIGAQIRVAVDTTPAKFVGDIAELMLWRGIAFTEEEARAIHNLGYPVRAQGPASMYMRYTFTSDATEVGGILPTFTLTGSPTFNDDSAHFNAYLLHPTIPIDNETVAEVPQANLDSIISHLQAVTVAAACWGTVGVVYDNADGVSVDKVINILCPTRAPHTIEFSASSYANRISEFVENSSRYFQLPFPGTFMVQASISGGLLDGSAGEMQGMSVRADTRGCCSLWGNSFHMSPTCIDHLGSFWRGHNGMDSRGSFSLEKDSTVIYSSDATAIQRNGDDTFHQGSVLQPQPAGISIYLTAHGGLLRGGYVPDSGFTGTITWHEILTGGGGGTVSYGQAVTDALGKTYMMCRGANDNSDDNDAVVTCHEPRGRIH